MWISNFNGSKKKLMLLRTLRKLGLELKHYRMHEVAKGIYIVVEE